MQNIEHNVGIPSKVDHTLNRERKKPKNKEKEF